MQRGLSDRQAICPCVCLSIRHTLELWQNESSKLPMSFNNEPKMNSVSFP